jgi:YD repeat-containing protein
VETFVIDGMHEGIVLRDGDHIASLVVDARVLDVQWDSDGRIVEFTDAAGTRRFAYREDGLLVRFSSPQRACTLTRNPLGVVVGQEQGDVTLQSPHVNHRGERYGLDLGDGTSISYLWSVDGQLDRIAVAGTSTFDFNLEHKRTALQSCAVSCDDELPTDALHRPIRDDRGRALVWDEDHLLRAGERLHVLEPRAGEVIAIVEGDQLHTQSEPPKGAGRKLRMEEQAFAESFPNRVGPQRFEDRVPTPLGLLRRTFACRVWDPIVRPLSGALPWQPDEWHPNDGDVTLESTRLEPATLMRLLPPLPRPWLRLGARPRSGTGPPAIAHQVSSLSERAHASRLSIVVVTSDGLAPEASMCSRISSRARPRRVVIVLVLSSSTSAISRAFSPSQ